MSLGYEWWWLRDSWRASGGRRCAFQIPSLCLFYGRDRNLLEEKSQNSVIEDIHWLYTEDMNIKCMCWIRLMYKCQMFKCDSMKCRGPVLLFVQLQMCFPQWATALNEIRQFGAGTRSFNAGTSWQVTWPFAIGVQPSKPGMKGVLYFTLFVHVVKPAPKGVLKQNKQFGIFESTGLNWLAAISFSCFSDRINAQLWPFRCRSEPIEQLYAVQLYTWLWKIWAFVLCPR